MPSLDSPNVRLDKFLWAVRLCKTRSQAADACRLQRVKISGQEVKPAHPLKIGTVLEIQLEDMTKTVRVIALLEHRVAAKLLPDYLEDLTPPEVYEEAKRKRIQNSMSPPIAPMFKPSKKDRELLSALYAPKDE